MRNKMSREKRKTADLLNRTALAKKKQTDNRSRQQKLDSERRNEEPFYERLRRLDLEREKVKKQTQRERNERRTKLAAYKNGKCVLNQVNWTEVAKKDEQRARREKAQIDARDQEREAKKRESIQRQRLAVSMSNLA